MAEWIRPGPARIEPDEAPGGLVVHVYGTDDARLLHVAKLRSVDDADRAGRSDAEAVLAALHPGEATCLVIYDGDSGDRYIAFRGDTVDVLDELTQGWFR